jgi:hypothetical protein
MGSFYNGMKCELGSISLASGNVVVKLKGSDGKTIYGTDLTVSQEGGRQEFNPPSDRSVSVWLTADDIRDLIAVLRDHLPYDDQEFMQGATAQEGLSE